jgi:hypothetical protein
MILTAAIIIIIISTSIIGPRRRLLFAVSNCWGRVIAADAEGPTAVARRRSKKAAQAGAGGEGSG